jgi:hypothetical protein
MQLLLNIPENCSTCEIREFEVFDDMPYGLIDYKTE